MSYSSLYGNTKYFWEAGHIHPATHSQEKRQHGLIDNVPKIFRVSLHNRFANGIGHHTRPNQGGSDVAKVELINNLHCAKFWNIATNSISPPQHVSFISPLLLTQLMVSRCGN